MKELHNHIFSNTTCISKETMLRYINKQLSKKELYEVEKHMLDCELCTDAYEGMKMARNSSMLFAIDNAIDLRAGGASKKSPIMRNLMVAASIMIIVFGGYFTINNFNESLEKKNLAINEQAVENANSASPENFIHQKTVEEVEVNKEEKAAVSGGTIVDEVVSEIKNTEQQKQAETIVVENQLDASNEEIEDIVLLEDDEQFNEAEASIEEYTAKESPSIPTEEDLTNRRNDNDVKDKVAGNAAIVTNIPNVDNNSDQIITKSRNKKNSKNKSAKKYKASFAEAEPVMEGSKMVDRKNTYDIYSYKVYDYAPEYQTKYELEKSAEIDVISSDFESKSDKDEAKKELEENVVEISYKQTLESGIKALKNEKYQLALTHFNLILKTHPKDVNALFYGGIAYYNLNQFAAAKSKFEEVLKNKQTTFNQEAKWYQAKNLIALKEMKKAKKILQEIIDANGFYKEQATEQLEGLE